MDTTTSIPVQRLLDANTEIEAQINDLSYEWSSFNYNQLMHYRQKLFFRCLPFLLKPLIRYKANKEILPEIIAAKKADLKIVQHALDVRHDSYAWLGNETITIDVCLLCLLGEYEDDV